MRIPVAVPNQNLSAARVATNTAAIDDNRSLIMVDWETSQYHIFLCPRCCRSCGPPIGMKIELEKCKRRTPYLFYFILDTPWKTGFSIPLVRLVAGCGHCRKIEHVCWSRKRISSIQFRSIVVFRVRRQKILFVTSFCRLSGGDALRLVVCPATVKNRVFTSASSTRCWVRSL